MGFFLLIDEIERSSTNLHPLKISLRVKWIWIRASFLHFQSFNVKNAAIIYFVWLYRERFSCFQIPVQTTDAKRSVERLKSRCLLRQR